MTEPRVSSSPRGAGTRTAISAVTVLLALTTAVGATGSAEAAPVAALAASPAVATVGVVPATPPAARRDGGAPRHFTPVTGAKFNTPFGGPKQRLRLYRHVLRAIESVPRGGTIRGAVFSFAEAATSRALIAAAARGVRVRLVFDGGRQFPSVKNLVRVLGTDTTKRSYVVLCDHSCRGTTGQMHAKFFQFTKVGDAKKVTMVGSNNITRYNSDEQWSDVYTQVGDVDYYRVFKHWFAQLRRDTPLADPFQETVVGGDTVMFTPVDLAVHVDPVLDALAPVGCQTATGPTQLRIAAHAWNGERGKTIARRVGALVGDGCSVRVVLGVGTGAAVQAILEDAGAELTTGTHRGIHTHEKLLIVSGHYGDDDDAVRVWTGSHNWSDRALHRDDIIVGITDPAVGEEYVTGFDRMWDIG